MSGEPAPDGHETESKAPSGGRAGPYDASITPKDLKVQLKEQQLTVDWQDGTHSELALGRLRRVCPCATCRTDRETAHGNPLQILKTDPTGLRVTSARLVGHYAIQFFWSDGHNTGIFDFRFLRSLAQGGAGPR